MTQLGYREVLALVLEYFATNPKGSYDHVVGGVGRAAITKALVVPDREGRMTHSDRHNLAEFVREAMWNCLIKRVLIFGMDDSNREWPWYRLTAQGVEAVKLGKPQPYDPHGFLSHFRTVAIGVDSIVIDYVTEAVHAFNSDCLRAAAVMLGGASEKMILVLIDVFESAITETTKKSEFTRDLARRRSISHQYSVLSDRLDLMCTARKLPHDLVETVRGELPSGFELLRRCRNSAGHPEAPGHVDEPTIYMNLRIFAEYARRVTALTTHIQAAGVDW